MAKGAVNGWIVGTVLVVVIVLVAGALYYLQTQRRAGGDLVIYSYDSFVTWGLGPEVETVFEEMYDVDIRIVPCGDVGTLIGKLHAEKGGPKADIALGIDNSMLRMAVDLLEPFTPSNIGLLDPALDFDPDHHVVPYDYGYIAIVCNGTLMEERSLPIPGSVLDLADPVYDGQIMLIDPATSSTGSSFLAWAASVAGDGLGDYLSGLADNADGKVVGTWDSMYAAFTAGETPIAISYGLDTASEVMYYGSSDTLTVVPEDEGYRQIEGCGIVKGARNTEMAENFMEFILTHEFQSRVGHNVMLPVVPGTPIDPIYTEHGSFATDHSEPSQQRMSDEFDEWMEMWDSRF